ncbi:MAG: GNAT family N-acetyltransferase [Candidatus Berkelbacteria bacterium]
MALLIMCQLSLILLLSKSQINGLLAELGTLYMGVWSAPPWCEQWSHFNACAEITALAEKMEAMIFAAVASEKVIGFCASYEMTAGELAKKTSLSLCLPAGRILYLAEMLVGAENRGQGVGVSLTLATITAAKTAGYGSVVLRTDIDAIPARKLYAKMGFCDTGISDVDHSTRTYWVLTL